MTAPFTIPLCGSEWLIWRIGRWETPETAVKAASARYREKYGHSPLAVLTAPGVVVPGVEAVSWSGCRPGEVWVGPIVRSGASLPSADDRVIGDDEDEPCA